MAGNVKIRPRYLLLSVSAPSTEGRGPLPLSTTPPSVTLLVTAFIGSLVSGAVLSYLVVIMVILMLPGLHRSDFVK